MIQLHLLGSVELKGPNGEELRSIIAQPKPMALLAYLAAASPVGYHRREELLSVFWPELDSARGRRALSQALHVLRNELEEGAIISRGVEEVAIDRAIISSDVDDFRSAISSNDMKRAADLYRGELLSGFLISGSPEFDQWLDSERARLNGQVVDAAWHLSSDRERAGDAQSAHRWARRAVELDPYSEEGVRRLLTLLDRTGNRAEAIRAYEEFRARVRRELESEPSKETRALAENLRVEPAARAKSTRAPLAAGDSLPAASRTDETIPVYAPPKRRLSLYVGIPLVIIGLVAAFVLARGRPNYGDRANEPQTSRLVIAEFESAPQDTALGRTITEALRLDLSRSHLIKVTSDATFRDALVLMKRDTTLRVTTDLAREVAVRENVKAVLAGDVRRTANGFVLSARLISPDGGDLINGWRAVARDSSELLKAIDQLSSSVRQEAGESVRAIGISSPLLRVSTTSLSALRKEVMGIDAFHSENYSRALALLNEAIAEDSTFTDAYMMLSTILFNSSVHPSRAIDAAIKAYRYRDKLRDAERYAVVFNYLWAVKGDVPQALDAEANAAAIDPVAVFWGRYANLLSQERRFREAELVSLRGLQWEPNPFVYVSLANARFRAGKVDEARRTVAYALRIYPTSQVVGGLRADMTEAVRNYAAADSLAHQLSSEPNSQQVFLDAIVGKIDEARQHLNDMRRSQEEAGAFAAVMATRLYQSRLEMEIAHDTTRALATADSISSTKEWSALFPNERPYAVLAHFYVTAGKLDRARRLLSDFDRNVPADYRAHDQWIVRRTRAMLRVADGDASQVEEIKSAYATDPQPMTALADIVWAYRRLGKKDEAARAARAFLDEINPRRAEEDAFNLETMRALAAGH